VRKSLNERILRDQNNGPRVNSAADTQRLNFFLLATIARLRVIEADKKFEAAAHTLHIGGDNLSRLL